MPNILLTRSCVRCCPYCFAGEHLQHTGKPELMSWENFIYIVDFFSRAGDRSMSLLGGEPLLHPELPAYIAYLLARGIEVDVFTSGIATEEQLDSLVKVAREMATPSSLTFIVNYNPPAITSRHHQEAIGRFLSELGPYITVGVNIYKTPYDLSHIPDLINRFNLQRHVRTGVANPVPGSRNRAVSPGMMKEIACDLVAQLPLFEASGITIGMDCGFPMCAFTDQQLGILYRHTNGGRSMSFICAPSTDIGPDMMVWNCFPVSGYESKSLFDFTDKEELDSWLGGFHHAVRIEHGGLYPECDDCRHRLRGLCSGGCLGHPLSQMYNEDDIVRNDRINRHK